MRKRLKKKKAKRFYISKEDSRLIAANIHRFKGQLQELWDECMNEAITKQFPYTKIGV